MKKLDKMSRTVGYLEKIFNHLNAEYFESALTMPVITVMTTPNAYGHMSVFKIWKKGEEYTREINIASGTLDRPIEEVVATLCHEMVHLWNIENNIQDTSRGGSYHNKRFKEKAEKCGLRIEHHDKYGWTITHVTDELLEFCMKHDLSEILINREETCFGGGISGKGKIDPETGVVIGTGTGKKPSSTRKYQCPCCKDSVRATKVVFIKCTKCDVDMEVVN